MKFCTKFIVFILTVLSLHHYCEWNHCSTDVKQFCNYTSFSTWNNILSANSETYHEYVAPKMIIVSTKYNTLIEPLCHSFSERLNAKVTKPIITFVTPHVAQFEHRPYVVFIHDKIECLINKLHVYYNIYLEQIVSKIEKQLGIKKTYNVAQTKFGSQFQPICEVFEPYLKGSKTKFQEWKIGYLNYIKDAKTFTESANKQIKETVKEEREKIQESIEEKKEQVKKIAKDRKESYINSKKSAAAASAAAAENVSTTSDIPKGKITPLLDNDIYSDLYEFRKEAENMNDEDFEALDNSGDDEEVYTSTSTIVKVVTLSEGADSVETQGQKDAVTNEDEVNAIQIDFDNWSDAIERKMSSIADLFEKDVNTTMDKILRSKDLTLKKMLRQMSNSSQDSYEDISKKIEDIDCITEIDPKTGEKIYFDKTGTTQLPVYVDRELMRDLFDHANSLGLTVVSQINAEVGNLDSDVYFAVEGMRRQYAEIYEEWANVMVNEWSKRLAYIDVMDADTGKNSDGAVSEENWKKFLKVKRQIIGRREEFATHPVSMDEVIKFSTMVQNTLMMINRENGEYLYILRSKANLAFQKREKEEAEMEAFDAEDEEDVQADA
ncbi:similar to Saccharomyces cerevisiae YGL228W SHE10 Putative glycosylphosphatidylinositol (GPI)-anchored protein of unknown function [Maudiozyma barnettii]|uniref:Outer spore wall assembly protein SHE10 n=1 Tax=Maudiozyma barnettii TaxID=61262 RepID=A0A8H2VB27_9SACH|nr:She10p [Kazachstania barnettii]CAB4251969.1 similar to Saccharomyces cerevisiae YGL228W SHE10 Putative glycosylphosphatidylinositol (GPI)-anchored protein of unknown function [Kazachstania barnettii]CAD1778357.1 similar to Saccharomyces cerevisiae YGL228W SHE10 Putative glycosylphosphatidylinositol (GPI)-anchored protein of unknown function [Kazachstania barnettii]